MSNSVPARVIFLSDLPYENQREKVRFLGCVDRYNSVSGLLTLSHRYPKHTKPISVNVNVDHVLESVKSSDLQIGSWVNVIGYVAGNGDEDGAEHPSGKASGKADISVQAVLLWNAGPLNLDEYEQALKARKKAMTTS